MGRILPAANSITNTGTVTVLDSNFTLQDNVDPTKQAQFQLSGISSAATRTYTLPNGTGIIPIVAGTGIGTATRIIVAVGNNGIQQAAGVTLDTSDYLAGVAGLTTTGFIVNKVRVVTAAGAVTVSATTDNIVIVNKTTGAATTVNLPASPTTGLTYTIKDGKGDAATNNITITPAAGTIDGAATSVISTNYGSRDIVYNGTQWNVI